MSFQAIRTAINTKLQSLTGVGNPLAYAYDYHKLGLDGYPSATFEPSALSSQFETTHQNGRVYAFDIIIHQELRTIGRDEAIGNLVSVSDAIIDAFDQDYTLGGVVDFIEAVPAEFGEVQTEDSVIAYSRITLKCHTLKSIF